MLGASRDTAPRGARPSRDTEIRRRPQSRPAIRARRNGRSSTSSSSTCRNGSTATIVVALTTRVPWRRVRRTRSVARPPTGSTVTPRTTPTRDPRARTRKPSAFASQYSRMLLPRSKTYCPTPLPYRGPTLGQTSAVDHGSLSQDVCETEDLRCGFDAAADLGPERSDSRELTSRCPASTGGGRLLRLDQNITQAP